MQIPFLLQIFIKKYFGHKGIIFLKSYKHEWVKSHRISKYNSVVLHSNAVSNCIPHLELKNMLVKGKGVN